MPHCDINPDNEIEPLRNIMSSSLNVNATAVVGLLAPPLAQFGAPLLHFDTFTSLRTKDAQPSEIRSHNYFDRNMSATSAA